MKLDEFIKKVNAMKGFKAGVLDGGIYVSSHNQPLTNYVFCFYKKARAYGEADYDLDCLPIDYEPEDLFRLFDLIHDYIKTPIKERFPEKKYRLRWLNDDDGDPNFMTKGMCGIWGVDSVEDSFTESELDKFKRDHPRLAPAIDAMKEPVEEK
ncbi:hypothetical protein L2520_03785 [Limosilactobacillus vaginalis]|uniref:Phage protein n=1 Tax=Limosilactobacillus vaginalis TaxID=1633 RepID=A0ABT4K6M9_9LACO|nr:hypothetical protein [Limosilactobacillus vaginalis]MCZ3746544.1 hypothetical protein [Limosilactobacillus vaginalis]MCZ3751564.1 hypothetical protein [Limosilactobacillus vaginalis]MCZ3753250.1 hypothetical protein [Limosilactobacillus vaginalis]MCZ3755064.1 hypothetical protein [Limosilactobacillus vaginalis]MCZ3756736.1 hypothetical protein [Limosilactobacillus vaginalis]